MTATTQIVQRQTAYIVSLQTILGGTFVQQEGWEPNFVQASDGQKLSRVHIVGTVITTAPPTSMHIDDGTGSIEVRDFESNPVIESLQIGTVVRIIAKVREYQSQKYLFPEIIVPLEDTTWLQIHKEMMARGAHTPSQAPADEPQQSEPIQQEEQHSKDLLPLIDSLDSGDGVHTDDIVAKASGDDIDAKEIKDTIQDLLLQGEIFEIKPDVVKVLK